MFEKYNPIKKSQIHTYTNRCRHICEEEAAERQNMDRKRIRRKRYKPNYRERQRERDDEETERDGDDEEDIRNQKRMTEEFEDMESEDVEDYGQG